MRVFIVSFIIFIFAIIMAMVGRGGGNFYVPVLVASNIDMNVAATTAQFILFLTALSSTLIFHKHKTIDWKLALVIDIPTNIMAFLGGYFAHYFNTSWLKFIFAGLLVLASFFMFKSVREKADYRSEKFGYWNRNFGNYNYTVNLWLSISITSLVGLFAGMVGISGGSFKIPLMVLACGVPMKIAIGTSSIMVAATAFMGLVGHSLAGDFDPQWAIPVAIVAVIGGLIGGKISIKTKPKHLKEIFAFTTLAAAGFMIYNGLL